MMQFQTRLQCKRCHDIGRETWTRDKLPPSKHANHYARDTFFLKICYLSHIWPRKGQILEKSEVFEYSNNFCQIFANNSIFEYLKIRYSSNPYIPQGHFKMRHTQSKYPRSGAITPNLATLPTLRAGRCFFWLRSRIFHFFRHNLLIFHWVSTNFL